IYLNPADKTVAAICASVLTLCSVHRASVGAPNRAQLQQDVQIVQQPALVVGKSIERDLQGGQIHVYSVTMTAGQFLSVVVDQLGIDLLVKVYGPDGRLISEFDSPNGTQGPEN